MNIYKYGLTQEKVIYVLECLVLQEKESRDGQLMYEVQEGNKKKWIYVIDLEVYSNKVMYSTSGDNKEKFISCLKEACKNTIESYYKKAEDTKHMLEEILKINNIE